MAVPSIEVVCVQTRAGILLGDVASIAVQALRARDWQRLSQSLDTKGERLFDWARLPIVYAGSTDEQHWLVIRRCPPDPSELAYFLVWAPPDTPLCVMVQAIGARWHIEEDLQTGKKLGLDHYEKECGKSNRSWYTPRRHHFACTSKYDVGRTPTKADAALPERENGNGSTSEFRQIRR